RVGRPVAQIVHVQVEDAGVLRTAQQGQRQSVEVRREDRDDVDAVCGATGRSRSAHASRVSGGHYSDAGAQPSGASGAPAASAPAPAGSSSNNPAGGVTTIRPAAMSTVGTIAAANGTMTSEDAVLTISRSCAGRCSTRTP